MNSRRTIIWCINVGAVRAFVLAFSTHSLWNVIFVQHWKWLFGDKYDILILHSGKIVFIDLKINRYIHKLHSFIRSFCFMRDDSIRHRTVCRVFSTIISRWRHQRNAILYWNNIRQKGEVCVHVCVRFVHVNLYKHH